MHGVLGLWRWLGWSLVAVTLALLPARSEARSYSKERRQALRALAEDTWRHAYDSYKRVAFPSDELLPLSCAAQGHDRVDPQNSGVNDVMGDYLLTVVDSLDTFPMLGDKPGFEQAVREILQHVSFDVDSRVQVFEVTIRMMGGLLAGHLLALEPAPPGSPQNGSTFTSSIRGFSLPWYRSELLHLAHDLGQRLLPAFDTPTGLPFARVHLQKGLRGKNGKDEAGETCAAGAGSLLLEFITLSRLTGDPRFELAARRAFFAVWNRRSDIALVGNTIDVRTGLWLHGVAGTGAGIDSFYEYAAKAYVLTGEDEYLRVWDEGYAALQRYVRSTDGFWYRGVNMQTGQLASTLVDSLSAFLPGVQALMGDLDSAARAHAPYAFAWARYGGLPELFDTHRRQGAGAQLGYPLRPEFIESNMYLYQATRDEWYLSVAERALHDINNRTRVECGFAAIKELRTGELEDKMPSFVTGETLKYLFLTFAEDSPFLRDDSAFVFTTEGHPLEIPHPPSAPSRRSRLRSKRPVDADSPTPRPAPTCAAHDPLADGRYAHFLALGMDRRTDWEHARWLAGHIPSDVEAAGLLADGTWRADGWCELPLGEDPVTLSTRYAASLAADHAAIELLFAHTSAGEISSPLPAQLAPHPSGNGDLVVHAIAGLRFSLARVPGTDGYVVTRVGGVNVPPGRSVVLRDEAVLAGLPQRRVERVLLTAAVAPKGEPPSGLRTDGEAVEERGGGRKKLDRFLEMMLGPRTPSAGPAGADECDAAPEDDECGPLAAECAADVENPGAPLGGADETIHPVSPTLRLPALAASFGPALAPSSASADGAFALAGPALPLALAPDYPYGCTPPPSQLSPSGALLLLRRGECSFALKAHHAARAGAAGVVLVSGDMEGASGEDVDGEGFVVPSADAADEREEVMRTLVPLVLVARTAGEQLEALVRGVQEANERSEEEWSAAHEDDVDGTDGPTEVFVTVVADEDDAEEGEILGNFVLGGYLTTNLKLYRGGRI